MSKPGKSPLLVTNLSEALLGLLAVDGSIVDAVEVGPWFSIEQISVFRRKLSGLPFIFHGANLVVEAGENLGVEERLQGYLASTGSPWASVHLSVWEVGNFDRLMQGERLPLPAPEETLSRLLKRLEILVKLIRIPLLVENIEPLPYAGYDYWSRPEYICRVLEKSGCGFLLDAGHLRVSAERLGTEVGNYLDQLPLERVVEIHVSGPRQRDGILMDAHQHLQAFDYRLLETLLSRTAPQAVTLEYTRDAGRLLQQLKHLRRLLDMGPAQPERSIQ